MGSFDRIPRRPRADNDLYPHNPILSAYQFATQVDRTGGATVTSRGKVMVPGEPAYFVGQHPAVGGGSVPTKVVSSINPADVLEERERIRSVAAQRPNPASLGAWVNPQTNQVELDATTTVFGRNKAVALGTARKELAVFDNSKMDTIWLNREGR